MASAPACRALRRGYHCFGEGSGVYPTRSYRSHRGFDTPGSSARISSGPGLAPGARAAVKGNGDTRQSRRLCCHSVGAHVSFLVGLHGLRYGPGFPEGVKDHRVVFPPCASAAPLLSSVFPPLPHHTVSRDRDHRQRADDQLENILDETRRRKLVRVVLIHHPPVPGIVSRRKGLADQTAFQSLLARHGAELILHGHTHRTVRTS